MSKSRRILILTRNRYLHAPRRLIGAFQRSGWDVIIADPMAVSPRAGAGQVSLFVGGAEIPLPDVLMARTSPVTRDAVLRLLYSLEGTVPVLVNPPRETAVACDKFVSIAKLGAGAIAVPPSAMVHSDEGLEESLAQLCTDRGVILKTPDGGKGRGVILAESVSSARSIAQALLDEGAPVLVQHYYAECRGRDFRAFVVGGKCVAAARREGKSGDFRANAHLGGTMQAADPTCPAGQLAELAVQALGLVVAGVDVLETDAGPVVIEVNSTPGLRGIEEACDMDVAAIVAHNVSVMLDQRKSDVL